MLKFRTYINSPSMILSKRHLGKNGEAQKFFTKECAKSFNNYVPFKTGRLKDISVELKIDKIIYNAPYARKQYYSNKGNGTGGLSVGGLRGKQWDKRGWIDNKANILFELGKFIGGHTK